MSYRFAGDMMAGAYHFGTSGLGVLGSTVPSTGQHGPSFLYACLNLPADADVEVRGLVLTTPSAGNWFAYEDGSFTLSNAPDGAYTFTFRLLADGVDMGVATGTILIGNSSILTGSFSLDDATWSGVLASSNGNALTGSFSLDDFQFVGNIAGYGTVAAEAGPKYRAHSWQNY